MVDNMNKHVPIQGVPPCLRYGREFLRARTLNGAFGALAYTCQTSCVCV